jgi:hypothetical protein
VSNVVVGARVPGVGAVLCAVVAAVEALALALGGLLALWDGTRGGSLPLGVAVGATGLGLGYLLARAAVASWRAERWPRGLLATTQVLAGLVALAVGAPTLVAPQAAPVAAALTAGVLVLAAAGLVGVWLVSREPAEPAAG